MYGAFRSRANTRCLLLINHQAFSKRTHELCRNPPSRALGAKARAIQHDEVPRDYEAALALSTVDSMSGGAFAHGIAAIGTAAWAYVGFAANTLQLVHVSTGLPWWATLAVRY